MAPRDLNSNYPWMGKEHMRNQKQPKQGIQRLQTRENRDWDPLGKKLRTELDLLKFTQ